MIPRNFPDQAARFATTRDTHARVMGNVRRRTAEIGSSAAAAAVEELAAGRPDVAFDIMLDCLAVQAANEKIRHLEAVTR